MKKFEETVYKVGMSIPTEGHTLPEAYDNHLLHAQRLGAWEWRAKYENQLVIMRERLKETVPHKTYRKILNPEVQSLKFHKIRYEFYWYSAGRLLTQMAREKLLTECLARGMDFAIMYDDDMVLPLEMAIKLLEDMQKHPEIDILAPLAFMRHSPYYAVLYNVIEGYDGVQHLPYYINTFVKHYPRNRIVEADAVGFGAVCIRMNTVRKMREPYFMSTTNTGEDIWFCVKAKREAKARIFMDTRIKLGHIGRPPIVDEEYFDKWLKESKHDLGPEEPSKYISYEK